MMTKPHRQARGGAAGVYLEGVRVSTRPDGPLLEIGERGGQRAGSENEREVLRLFLREAARDLAVAGDARIDARRRLDDLVEHDREKTPDVLARYARERRGAHVGGDLAFDAACGQRARRERIDRCLELRRRDRQGVVGVSSRVQQLQADMTTSLVNRLRQWNVQLDMFGVGQQGTALHIGRTFIRSHTARHNQPDAPSYPFKIVSTQAFPAAAGAAAAV